MWRREFLALTAAIVWSLGARAQNVAVPVIGYLSSPSAEAYASFRPTFPEGLKNSASSKVET